MLQLWTGFGIFFGPDYWPVFCHLMWQDCAYEVLLQIEVQQNCLWCTFNCSCRPGSFQEVGSELDCPSMSTVIHDSLNWIRSHFPHGTAQLDVGIAPNHVTHVVWNPGTRYFGAPVIKFLVPSPLYSFWKIIRIDLRGDSNKWILTKC